MNSSNLNTSTLLVNSIGSNLATKTSQSKFHPNQIVSSSQSFIRTVALPSNLSGKPLMLAQPTDGE